ncbi:MAG: hypothetical protein KJ558_12550, partial [Gammaproteobacteria bacterium]|nr:hypothetical protein [Gammaproteobacteria bacterium]
MNRHFQWPKPLKMKKTKNRIFRFRLAKWSGRPFCKFISIISVLTAKELSGNKLDNIALRFRSDLVDLIEQNRLFSRQSRSHRRGSG